MSELLLLAITLGAGALLVVLGILDVSSWKDRTSWAFASKDPKGKGRNLSKLMGGLFGVVGVLVFAVILAIVFSTP